MAANFNPSAGSYQMLNSVSDEEGSSNPSNMDEQPPTYEAASSSISVQNEVAGSATNSSMPKKNDGEFIPPSYEAATSLPTYEDVEKLKEDEARREVVDTIFNLRGDSDELLIDGLAVGNDCMFIFAFIIGFLFNWIGLFVGYFIMFNLAGRYGALAGFGTSVIKWMIFIKYSDCCQDYFMNQHDYMWWILCFFGFVVMLKGTLNWMTLRKYQNLTSSEYRQHVQYAMIE